MIGTFVALLAFLVLAYAVHVAHDVARRWLADRAEARTQQVGLDGAKLGELEQRVVVVEKRGSEHQAAIAAMASRSVRR